MHLFSEPAVWKTESEFILPDGKISRVLGETSIVVQKSEIKINRDNLLFGNYGYTSQIARGKQYIQG